MSGYSSRNSKLNELGYTSYSAYLKSDSWKNKKEEYRRSGLPTQCLVCDTARYELHHRSYERIGQELVTDLIPLCRDCHQAVHDYLDAHPESKLNQTHAIIREVFGWSKGLTAKKFRPFSVYNPRAKNRHNYRWIPREGETVEGNIKRQLDSIKKNAKRKKSKSKPKPKKKKKKERKPIEAAPTTNNKTKKKKRPISDGPIGILPSPVKEISSANSTTPVKPTEPTQGLKGFMQASKRRG